MLLFLSLFNGLLFGKIAFLSIDLLSFKAGFLRGNKSGSFF